MEDEEAWRHRLKNPAAIIRSEAEGVARRRAKAQENLDAQGEAKARQIVATARRCRVCGTGVISYGRDTHFACEDPMVGSRCTCLGKCTDVTYGDQGTCAEDCIPCRVQRGRRYSKR